MEVDAIRGTEEIEKMKEFFRRRGAEYELLFVIGINTALRIGDLLSLSVGDVMDENGDIVSVVVLKEKKTGKIKRCPVNESIRSPSGEPSPDIFRITDGVYLPIRFSSREKEGL